ncbi:hypothetical protein HDU67_005488 [Dinochytrium kinnereticum]|nr:hypothetical protein HDU67_005488 [Dinochytrium kinnereticum]
MTRTHSHSSSITVKDLPTRERHYQRHGGDLRGPIKKNGAGKHNWGTIEDEEEMILEDQAAHPDAVLHHDPQDMQHLRVVGRDELEERERAQRVVQVVGEEERKGTEEDVEE